MKTPWLRGSFIVLACALTVFPALAAEGRIPIWLNNTVIAADGKYFLTRNLCAGVGGPCPVLGAGGSAIVVAPGVANVDIDLNGFTVFGDPGGSPAVIDIVGPRASVTIRNGEVRNLAPAGGGHCIRVTGGGLPATVVKAVIEDVKTQDGDVGILLEDVLEFSLRRNVVSGAGLDGIAALGFGLPAALSMTGTIEDGLTHTTGGAGIHVDGAHSAVAIKNNRVEAAGGDGILVLGGSGFIIAENTVEDSGANGIHAEAANNAKIYNNTIFRSGGPAGIFLVALGGFLVLDNVSSGNAGDGIFADTFTCHIDRNVLSANGGCGLHFGPGSAENTYGRNTAKFNGGCPCAFVAASEVCPFPYGGGSAPPDFCNEGVAAPAPPANDSFCDNLMPGPPRS